MLVQLSRACLRSPERGAELSLLALADICLVWQGRYFVMPFWECSSSNMCWCAERLYIGTL